MTAMFNNYPLGFYSAATLVKDAQRHCLHFLPLDINRSDYLFRVEDDKVRLGLKYVRGLREEVGKKIEEERVLGGRYTSIADIIDRVPEINKREIRALSMAGALNFDNTVHRREALWQSELAIRPEGPLFDRGRVSSPHVSKGSSPPSGALTHVRATDTSSPSFITRMEGIELIDADLRKTGISIGRHPMAFIREELKQRGILSSTDARYLKKGQIVSVAGAVIIRQRPMTAKNVVFITLEDEFGFSNFVVMPDKFEQYRAVINQSDFLVIRGIFEERGMLKAVHFEPVTNLQTEVLSHDFR